MQIYFLQVMCWGYFINLILEQTFKPLKAIGLGILLVSLLLSHPASVLIDTVVLGSFICVLCIYLIYQKQWQQLKICVTHGLVSAGIALFFALFLYNFGGKLKFVVPSLDLASSALDYINLNFSVFLWIVLLLLHPVITKVAIKTFKSHSLLDEWGTAVAILAAACFYLFGLPALSIMIISASIIYLTLYQKESSQQEKVLCLFAICSFSIWLLPEIFAFDHALDSRTDWIRFQMSLRFWPEGYLLIPFATSLAALPLLGRSSTNKIWNSFGTLIVILIMLSHIPGISNRIGRSKQPYNTLDGFDDFARQYPDDSNIVSFLRNLPETPKVIIAESCGVGDSRIPLHFAWPGRLAAFSGRLGICGWTRHAMLYNNPLTQKGFNGTSVEEKSSAYLDSYLSFFKHCATGDLLNAKVAMMSLKAFGVTHITFGQFEKYMFPTFSIEQVSPDLSVSVVYKTSNGLGVIKINE